MGGFLELKFCLGGGFSLWFIWILYGFLVGGTIGGGLVLVFFLSMDLRGLVVGGVGLVLGGFFITGCVRDFRVSW